MNKPTIKVLQDHTKHFLDVIKSFKDLEVVVGVPESESAREDMEGGGQITNAAILFINENGSPARNIPERPVMKLGLSKAADDIADQFAFAAEKALDGGQAAIEKYYNRAGFIASSSIKNVINDQMGIVEPAESTLAARKRKGYGSEKALIVTGQLRNSITHIVRRRR